MIALLGISLDQTRVSINIFNDLYVQKVLIVPFKLLFQDQISSSTTFKCHLVSRLDLHFLQPTQFPKNFTTIFMIKGIPGSKAKYQLDFAFFINDLKKNMSSRFHENLKTTSSGQFSSQNSAHIWTGVNIWLCSHD